MWYQNIHSALFSFITIHASDGRTDGRTDRRTDGRTELRQQYRALHYMQSHGKNKKSLFEPPFRGLRGNIRTPSMTRWKVHCRLYIRHVGLLLISSTVVTLRAEIGRSRRFSKGVSHFERRFKREGGIAHQPLLVSEDWSDCRFVRFQNICSPSFSFVTIHASDRRTDGRTDGQNCDSNTVRYITRSRTVKNEA